MSTVQRKTKVVNGVEFDITTLGAVCDILLDPRHSARYPDSRRIRLFYGDRATGLAWAEEHCTMGYVGMSTGYPKLPLLMGTMASRGGEAILDWVIIKIVETKSKRVLYQHPTFHMPQITVVQNKVFIGGVEYATCNSVEKAVRLADFMLGNRHSK